MKTKMKVVIILVFVMSSLQSFSQEITEVKKNDLNGKVKSVTEYTYAAVKKNNETKKRGLVGRRSMLFNERGNLIEKFEIGGGAYVQPESDDEIIQIDTTYGTREVYTYNENSLLINISYFELNGVLRRSTSFVYDSKNNIMLRSSYDADGQYSLDGKHVFKYDDNNNLIEESKYFYGDYSGKCNFLYDDNGRLISVEDIGSDGNSSKTSYKYDNNGNKIEEANYSNGNLDWKDVFENENGKIIKETRFDAYGRIGGMNPQHRYHRFDQFGNIIENLNTKTNDDSLNDKTSYSYKYDIRSNWIQCNSYSQYLSEPEKPETIIERVITYYE